MAEHTLRPDQLLHTWDNSLLLEREKGVSREDACNLCSLAGDLRISQIVDAPNWCVSFSMALSVFR